MFRVKISDTRSVAFTFNHHIFDTPKEIKPKVWVKSQTLCSFDNGYGTLIYDWAYCSVQDVFDKEKGRKVALAKVMEAAQLTKDERTLVWSRYFNRHVSNGEYEVLAEIVDGAI